jgi:uncharacterized protein
MNYLVTGASGFIGQHLTQALLDRGDSVHYLARRKSNRIDQRAIFHAWQTESQPVLEEVPFFHAVIHLAGEPVSQRWNTEVKRKIFDSRVDGTRHLVSALGKRSQPPAVLVSASAIGYYGNRGDEALTEDSAPGSDFLAEVCIAWEREAARAREFGMRVVPIRISVVLGREGGALPKMLTPFRLGLGGRLGSGRQWMSWIHAGDLVRLILFAIENETVIDVLNGSSPDPVTNLEFTHALAKAVHRPALFPVPPAALRLALGEMAGAVLGSQKVLPQAAQRYGFAFRFPVLADALQELLRSATL